MSSKIKVDTIENVAGSGNVSLGSGHNLVVPGNITGSGNATITGDLTVDTNTLFVDASDNTVGIKNSAPGSYLDGELTVGDSSKDQYINVVTGTSNAAGLCFQDVTGTSIVSGLRYTHLDNKLAFWANGGEKANINSDGHFTVSQQLTCLLYKNGNQNVSQNTGFQVTGWAAVNDPASMYNNSNGRITVPTAGQYIVGGHIQTNQLGGVHFSILKNGAAIGVDSYLNMGDTLGSGYSICINCSSNDYFTMGGYVTTNSTVVSANRSKFWIQKVA